MQLRFDLSRGNWLCIVLCAYSEQWCMVMLDWTHIRHHLIMPPTSLVPCVLHKAHIVSSHS